MHAGLAQAVVPQWRRCLLPRQTRRSARKTLVLDLDETLVHSTLDSFDKVSGQGPRGSAGDHWLRYVCRFMLSNSSRPCVPRG